MWLTAALATFVLLTNTSLSAQSRIAPRSITVATEPNAAVWIDGVRYGTTDENGKLTIKTTAGRKTIRVRADSFAEVSKPLLPTQREVSISLIKTTEEAELTFQEAERLTSVDRIKAAEAYRKAIRLKPRYAAAYIGLARVLSDAGDNEPALKAIVDLRRFNPANAEASAIEGRIYKELGNEKKAIASFKRAIAEGKGFQPEAYAGLGLLYKEKAEGLGSEADETQANTGVREATKNLTIAVRQLAGAPDAMIIYQLLGLIHEHQKKYNEAIAVYEEFLSVFPDSSESEAVRSFIVQIKKQLSEQP
jgi:tetratricopeptide (TPR) repeat protein